MQWMDGFRESESLFSQSQRKNSHKSLRGRQKIKFLFLFVSRFFYRKGTETQGKSGRGAKRYCRNTTQAQSRRSSIDRKVTATERWDSLRTGYLCSSSRLSAHGAITAGSYAYWLTKMVIRDLLTSPSSASALMAARAILVRSISKNLRNAARASLRPKPSVPSVT